MVARRRSRPSPLQALVAEYRYNGLGYRISWKYDTDSDNDVDANDKTYYFCYDERWRVIATYRESDSSPKERFVHHASGLGGSGGSSYIDAVILRQKDANGGGGWTGAADGVLEQRHYYCQNWRADVAALLTDAGKMVEWVKYSSYGVPFALPAGDTESDADWDASDESTITAESPSYDIRRDAELDGDVDAADATYADSITGGDQTLGRGKLTSTSVENRIAYAGYQYDRAFFGAERHLSHVRHRVLDSGLGRWAQRDPSGYRTGPSLITYTEANPCVVTDPNGLCAARTCGASSSGRQFTVDGGTQPCGIEVRCAPLPNTIGAEHCYIVNTCNNRACRGGPNLGPRRPAQNCPPGAPQGPFGPIRTTCDDWDPEFPDWDDDDRTKIDGSKTVEPFDGLWECIERTIGEWDCQYAYQLYGPNSNSIIGAALRCCLPVCGDACEPPSGMPHPAWGWHTQLPCLAND